MTFEEHVEAVRLVTGRSANGWHDLTQEQYEAGDAGIEHIVHAYNRLRKALAAIESHDELEDDFGGKCGCVAIAREALEDR